MWFSAKLLFEARHDDPPAGERVLREESIVLFEALDYRAAKAEIPKIALGHEVAYQNPEGETVRWTRLEVLEVRDLRETDVYSGMEVFSHLFWGLASKPPRRTAK